jgi:hypothetical protein
MGLLMEGEFECMADAMDERDYAFDQGVQQERQRWLTWYFRHQGGCLCQICKDVQSLVDLEESRKPENAQ